MSERKYKVRTTDDVTWSAGLNIEGRIVERGTLTIEGKPRPFMVVDTGVQLARIFHSEALDEAFAQAAVGDMISATAREVERTKAGRTYRPFSVQLWTEAPAKA